MVGQKGIPICPLQLQIKSESLRPLLCLPLSAFSLQWFLQLRLLGAFPHDLTFGALRSHALQLLSPGMTSWYLSASSALYLTSSLRCKHPSGRVLPLNGQGRKPAFNCKASEQTLDRKACCSFPGKWHSRQHCQACESHLHSAFQKPLLKSELRFMTTLLN